METANEYGQSTQSWPPQPAFSPREKGFKEITPQSHVRINHLSTTITSTVAILVNVLTTLGKLSAELGHEIRIFFVFTPIDSASEGSSCKYK